MSPKTKATFECIECGTSYLRWQGQCDQCSEWNSLEPITIIVNRHEPNANGTKVIRLADVQEPKTSRTSAGFEELDRVLGKGWVRGSVNLICGEPGVGKSTLVLQSSLACASKQQKTLYLTAEESDIQVKQRAKRLQPTLPDSMYISATTDMDAAVQMIQNERPDVVVLDSIQMVMSTALSSMPGALNQVRLCASLFIKAVKAVGAIGILVGHITKDGQLAGPKTLEHMVDVILFFEGERSLSVRMLRALKNRYGTTNETGLFRMKSDGLDELGPHDQLISDLNKPPMAGSVITAVLSGTRGMLVELQSLVVPAGYQQIKRTFVGLDSHRSHVMIAILGKFFQLKLASNDIFLSLVGGIKSQLPDIDLAICFSIWSSHFSRPLPKQLAILGEVGLTGEVLPIAHLDRYVSAMAVLGITSCILPKLCASDWPEDSVVSPVFVETIFDAYTLFNTLAYKPTVKK
ncbi:MAG: DNA repair protein RadA [Candidatus Marinamargulisbacteria bacterium]